jgi:hypothetical protein
VIAGFPKQHISKFNIQRSVTYEKEAVKASVSSPSQKTFEEKRTVVSGQKNFPQGQDEVHAGASDSPQIVQGKSHSPQTRHRV